MSILERNNALFSKVIRERGTRYYQEGRVDILHADDVNIMAEVRGTEIYEVAADLIGDALCLSCTCPYAEQDFCKHIYAVMLKIDREGLLPLYKHRSRLRLRLVFPDELFETHSEDEGADFPADHLPESEARPSWSDCLDDIRETFSRQEADALPARKSDQEIIYVLRQTSGYSYTTQPSDLVLNISGRTRKKNGTWGQIKSINLSADTQAQMDVEDARIVTILKGAQSPFDYYRSNYGQTGFMISKTLAEVVMPLMAASGRLFFQNDRDETLMGPLSWHPDEVWTLQLSLRPDASGECYECALEMKNGTTILPVAQPLMITREGLMLIDRKLCRIDAQGALPWIEKFRGQENLVISKTQVHDFIGRIYSLPGLPPLSFPDDLKVEEITAAAQCCIVLRTEDAYYYLQDKKRFRATLYFRYRDCDVAAHPRGRGFYAKPHRLYLLRDAQAEKTAYETLLGLGFKTAKDRGDDATHEIDADKFARVVSELTARGWHVEADGKLYREAGSFSFSITTGIDWFELDGACDFENQKATLPALLTALQKKQSLIELDDGTFGVIPEAMLKKYAFLADMGDMRGGRVRFKKSQAGLLDALLAAEPKATCDALFENTRRQLQSFCGIEPGSAPDSFQGTLRRYQEEALGWFEFLRQFSFGGCLADDMGLGKTVQVLALLEKRRLLRQYEIRTGAGLPDPANSESAGDAGIRPSLVVAPRSVIFNWQREAARFTPRLRVLDHTGQTRKVGSAHFENYDLVLTTYGTLRRDAVAFRDTEFDYAILDEAQAIKNSDTAAAKAVRLLKARHRLALSGTPIENHLSDLWSLFEFLNPGLLGSASVFKRSTTDATAATPETRSMLAQALKPFILRRTKALVAPELPQKTEQVIYCEMDKTQTRLYNELRDHYRRSLLKQIDRDGMGKSKMHILEALLRLRQAACHPGLLDDKWKTGASAKTEFLLPQIAEILEEGHKALIFSQFTSFLSIVRNQLNENGHKYLYLDGKTKDREKLVRAFQEENEAPLFLISLRAGGLGLNLTAAEYVYLLDPWWNPAVEAQAIDRTHRIGQTEQVFAYRLITRNTVEERVLELQRSKRDLFAALIREDTSLLSSLGREDLEVLLS